MTYTCPLDGHVADGIIPRDFLEDISTGGAIMGLILAIGAVVSVIPQHRKILRTKSVKGLSGDWLSLMVLGQFCSLWNVFLLKLPVFNACSVDGFGSCWKNLMPLAQVGGLFLGASPLLVYFIRFYHTHNDPIRKKIHFRATVCLYLLVAWAIGWVSFGVLMWLKEGVCSPADQGVAIFLGLLSTGTTLAQYTPQLYQTYVERGAEALSLKMLAMQIPGGYIMVAYMMATGESWTTWMAFLAASVQQTMLGAMLIYFKRVDRTVDTKDTIPLLTNNDASVDERGAPVSLMGPLPGVKGGLGHLGEDDEDEVSYQNTW